MILPFLEYFDTNSCSPTCRPHSNAKNANRDREIHCVLFCHYSHRTCCLCLQRRCKCVYSRKSRDFCANLMLTFSICVHMFPVPCAA